jgi:hypothetical protein
MRRFVMISFKNTDGPQEVRVPRDAGSLGMRLAGDTPTLALLASDDGAETTITVERIGDFELVPDDARYLGMTQEHPGAPVYAWFKV